MTLLVDTDDWGQPIVVAHRGEWSQPNSGAIDDARMYSAVIAMRDQYIRGRAELTVAMRTAHDIGRRIAQLEADQAATSRRLAQIATPPVPAGVLVPEGFLDDVTAAIHEIMGEGAVALLADAGELRVSMAYDDELSDRFDAFVDQWWLENVERVKGELRVLLDVR